MKVSKVNMPDASGTPIRRAARRLRWFKEIFHRQMQVLEEQTGIAFEVDENELRVLFLRWLEAFEAQKPQDDSSKEDYVSFASGLMLRELVESKPLKVTSLPQGHDKSNPAFFWPEGYMYVVLCLNIRSAVMEQEFDAERHISPEMEDLRTWWSFKENIAEDPNLAIGFFDLFSGTDPSWETPSIFSARKSDGVASKYFATPQGDRLVMAEPKK